MSKTSLEELVNKLRTYLENGVTQMKKQISVECQMASFLY